MSGFGLLARASETSPSSKTLFARESLKGQLRGCGESRRPRGGGTYRVRSLTGDLVPWEHSSTDAPNCNEEMSFIPQTLQK